MTRRRQRSRSRRLPFFSEPDWVDVDLPDDGLFDDDDDALDDEAPTRRVPPPTGPSPRPPATGSWKNEVDRIAAALRMPRPGWPPGREIQYVFSVPDTVGTAGLALDVGCRQQKKNGEWRHLTSFRLSPAEIQRLPDDADRRILATLSGDGGSFGYSYPRSTYPGRPYLRYHMPAALLVSLVPAIVGTGRATLRVLVHEEPAPVAWDDGPPWKFRLDMRAAGPRHYVVTGVLARAEERLPLDEALLLLDGGVVVFADRSARLDAGEDAFAWIRHLRQAGAIRVPADQADGFLAEMLKMPALPPHDLPAELVYETARPPGRPRLHIRRGAPEWAPDLFRAELAFDYDGVVIEAERADRGVLDAERRRLILRSEVDEGRARQRLVELGARPRSCIGRDGWTRTLSLGARSVPRVARVLLEEGWHVEADGGVYRKPGAFHLSVSSGIDWFELSGTVEFGETVAHLPALLMALRRGDSTVRLGDGTYGLLPEEWLRKYAPLVGLGTAAGNRLRFTRAQVGLLDALLAAQPDSDVDAIFVRARQELRKFTGVAAADAPEGFTGRLRQYQREGLGWLHFLRQFGFGGCLADDMGLGKTVMVLALLEARRAGGGKKPSLVVMPRSLVFNWKAEAARFAPALSLLDHTGGGRSPTGAQFADHDVILTTYGTLRRDAAQLKDVEFDYVVLDETQAIKNATTDAAKAVRLLRGDHRLALSGTPVENHLGELWSLMDFLNPGMLGAAAALKLDGGAGRAPDEATRSLLASALRPFILRRTKAQVAPELPARTEQTVYCEMEPRQRHLYSELRDHYRASLLGRIDTVGLKRSKIMILEALLRLRQAACHPGLIDRSRSDEPAGKLDVLLPRLREVLDEGHKALVFSQFTSFLAIVRRRVEAEHIRYEYLDGATRDRQARVTRFQTDPQCRLFLVSLKAGGLGLNLTAAEHVFILDPWWNPAVEAQAIDRAHRIGQTRHVLAFRLIARETVEEKILALQADKRALAEAIIDERNSLIRTLTREDLELLLS